MTLKLKNLELLKSRSYINGQWVTADNGAVVDVNNPATGEMIAAIASLGGHEARRAIEGAQAALPLWRAKSAKERAKLLRRWYDLILENKDDLAMILTAEQGKPLMEAVGEINYGASYIEWFAEEGKRIYGDVISPPSNDKRLLVVKEPVGVVAAITPWNFPSAMITRKAGPALAAGCTFVCKPATETPLSALALAVLSEQAGIPPGVFNIICGEDSRAIGSEMTSNPLVRKLTFTGSTPVGKILTRQCVSTLKKTSMELGGNAPFIIFDDADLDAAVQGVITSKYRNAGQTCVCSNRILVQEGVYDLFVEKLVSSVADFKLGNGFDDHVTMGPLINAKAVKQMDILVQDSIEKGAEIVSGGSISEQGECFFEPTILVNVNSTMKVFREEIFGPVAPIFKFRTESEAIALANDTEFGLASYFYSRDIGRIWRVAEALEYGMVGINEGIISNEMAPFGGVKESGSGREGSKYGIEDYLEIKYMCLGGIE